MENLSIRFGKYFHSTLLSNKKILLYMEKKSSDDKDLDTMNRSLKDSLQNLKRLHMSAREVRSEQERNRRVHAWTEKAKLQIAYPKGESPLPRDVEKAKKLLEIARIYIQMKSLDEAIVPLRRAIRYDYNNPDILAKLAEVSLDRNELMRARGYARKLGRIKSKRGISEYILGQICMEEREWDEAVSHFGWIIKNKPKNLDARKLALIYCNLATCSHRLFERKKAFEYLKLSLKYGPTNFQTLFNLGITYGNQGDHKKAKELFQKAVKVRPTSPKALVHLARALAALGEYKKSLSLVNKIIKAAPTHQTNYNAYSVKAMIFEKQGKYESAINALNDGLLFDARNVRLLKQKSDLQIDTVDWVGYYQTNRSLSKVANATPLRHVALGNMVFALTRQKRYGEANKLLDQILKENRSFLPALRSKFDVALNLGDFSTADKLADEMIKRKNDFTSNNMKINVLIKLEKYSEALKLIKKQLKSKTLDAENLSLSIGDMLGIAMGTHKKKHYKILETLCKKFIKKYSSDKNEEESLIDVYSCLNWLNAVNNKEKEFDKLMQTIRKLRIKFLKEIGVDKMDENTLFANHLYNFACAFAIAGNKTMAMKYLKEADKLDPDTNFLKLSKLDEDFLNIKE